MPKRLLQVTDETNLFTGIRLLELVDATEIYQYAILSHCWGDEQTSRLLKGNLASLEIGIDEVTLTKVYRDAILVTRTARLSYIWIG